MRVSTQSVNREPMQRVTLASLRRVSNKGRQTRVITKSWRTCGHTPWREPGPWCPRCAGFWVLLFSLVQVALLYLPLVLDLSTPPTLWTPPPPAPPR